MLVYERRDNLKLSKNVRPSIKKESGKCQKSLSDGTGSAPREFAL